MPQHSPPTKAPSLWGLHVSGRHFHEAPALPTQARLQGSIVLRQCRDPGTTYSCKPEMAALRPSFLGSSVHPNMESLPSGWHLSVPCSRSSETKLLLALPALGLAGCSGSFLIYLPPHSLLRCAHLHIAHAAACRTCRSHSAVIGVPFHLRF